MRQYEVAIVGGGAMGSAAAWQLSKRGVDVVLLERYRIGHVNGGSHGSARIVRLGYADPFYVELAAAAFDRWDELEDEAGESLRTHTGVVDHGDPPTIHALAVALTAAGHGAEWLSPESAAERWPGLRFDGDVLYQPRGGQAHADRTVAALQRLAAGHGAHVRHDVRVTRLEPVGDGVDVHTEDEVLRAAQVVVAAGPWSPSLLGGLVPLPELTVTVEQPAHFRPRSELTPWPSFIHHQGDAVTWAGASPRGTYGMGSPDGVKVGFHATGRIITDPGGANVPDPDRVRELEEYVERWIPGVVPAAIEVSTCLYDLTPSTDFVIDRVGPVTVATGFSGHGFKFTPEIGRIVADLVLGVDVAPERFRLGSGT